MPKTSPNAQAIARRAARATRVERLTPRAYQIALIAVMCLPAYGEASAKDMKLVVRREYMRRNPGCGFVISLLIGLSINLLVQWIIKWIYQDGTPRMSSLRLEAFDALERLGSD